MKRPRLLFASGLVASLSTFAAGGCTLLVPFDDYREDPADGGDAAADVASTTDATSEGGCVGPDCVAPPTGEIVLALQNARAVRVTSKGQLLVVANEIRADGGGSAALVSVAPDGGVRRLAGGADPVARPYLLAEPVSATWVMWLGGDRIYRYGIDAGTDAGDAGDAAASLVQVFNDSANTRGITYDGTRVLMARSSGARYYAFSPYADPLSSADTVSVASAPSGSQTAIATTEGAGRIVIAVGQTIAAFQRGDGGTYATLAVGTRDVNRVVSDGTFAAWIVGAPDGGAPSGESGVRATTIEPPGTINQLRSGLVTDLTIDDSVVYWVEPDGSVYRAPAAGLAAGAKPILIAKGPAGPTAITTTPDHVYWATPTDVRRALKSPP